MRTPSLAGALSLASILVGGTGCAGTTTGPAVPDARGTIAVVVAHPDDETAFGGTLARFGREAEVHLVVAMDGRYGVRAHAGIPEGDSLAEGRAEEAKCSAQRLGLADVHLLGAHGGLEMRDGMREYFRR